MHRPHLPKLKPPRFSALNSLGARLLLTASCVLVVFVVLSGAGLEQAFVQSALQSQRDRMQGLVYALLGAAEPSPKNGLDIPAEALPDPRLTRVQSGLAAVIFDADGNAVWSSQSLSGSLPPVEAPPVGATLLRQEGGSFVFSFGIRWYGESNHPRRYTIALIEDQTDYRAQLNAFRRTLWISLGASALILVLVQFFLLRWGLSPLRHLAAEIRQIELGRQPRIESEYPGELMPLAHNLNAMIRSERTQLTRYRNALGDLAHSLKTPLAVLRGIAESAETPAVLAQQIGEPLARMEDIADYQLRRAAAAGRRVLSEPVVIRPLAEKTLAALAKVYAEKGLELRNDIDPQLRVRADEGDLYEILGNLLDNACKWARREVRAGGTSIGELRIDVEDDGPGFPERPEQLLARGVRADTRVAGQGIGLSTVADIVGLNDGRIELGRSEILGGARVRCYWPV